MKIVNYKLKIIVTAAAFTVVVPMFVSAAGLVPCNGTDCTFCDLFLLLQNLFNFIVGTLVPIIAVGMVVLGGYKLLTAGLNPNAVSEAKKILLNTFIGLLIVYASFIAASYVVGFFAKTTGAVDYGFHGNSFSFSCQSTSPAIDLSKWLSGGKVIIDIKGDESAPKGGGGPVTTGMTVINDVGVETGVDWVDVNKGAWQSLQQAANDPSLYDQGVVLVVSSGYRDPQKQAALVQQNCPAGATSSNQCNPPTCIPSATGSNCPHTAGAAVDVHGFLNGVQCPNDSACQQKVINAMKAQGFCNLASEAWHFEKPKISATCNY